MQTSEVTNAQSADLIIYMEVEQVNHRVNGILRYINVIKLSFNYINILYIFIYIPSTVFTKLRSQNNTKLPRW